MSLDDNYLREQIEKFRASIGPIYWFNSDFSEQLSFWAKKNGIMTVRSEWNDFWSHWRELPIDVEAQDLAAAWYLAVCEAVEEIEGGSLGGLERSLGKWQPMEIPEELRRLASILALAGAAVGEPGKTRLIDGRKPRVIELALRTRMMDTDIPLPIIRKTFDPKPS